MADYNELCRTAGFEVIDDDQDLYIIKNLDPEPGKNVQDGVKLEKEDSFNLDDIDIDLGRFRLNVYHHFLGNVYH